MSCYAQGSKSLPVKFCEDPQNLRPRAQMALENVDSFQYLMFKLISVHPTTLDSGHVKELDYLKSPHNFFFK